MQELFLRSLVQNPRLGQTGQTTDSSVTKKITATPERLSEN
ncbi:hypothetical protein HNQ72_005014 [Rhizobium wenxiniae]|uniref:Uncharacterized protein n=1 Tax=Rhizobium wenxiniae TaxID=1737357 RepID=A0A7W9YCF6_9HYPH|nr:hypothetical protein [Rhizobium wenxiniae]